MSLAGAWTALATGRLSLGGASSSVSAGPLSPGGGTMSFAGAAAPLVGASVSLVGATAASSGRSFSLSGMGLKGSDGGAKPRRAQMRARGSSLERCRAAKAREHSVREGGAGASMRAASARNSGAHP